ncbi:MAG: mechanosensitive ion channel protein, partial [Chitinophagaceae bacterium]
MPLPQFRSWFLLVLLLFICGVSFGQANKSTTQDTLTGSKGFVAKMQDFAKKSAISSAEDLATDKAELTQDATIVEIKKNLQKAKLYLRTSVDTIAAKRELALIANYEMLVVGDFIKDKWNAQTYRNLVTTEKILKVLLSRCNIQKDKLDNHKKRLFGFKYQMDSLSSVKALFAFPTDSVKLSNYIQALYILAKDVAPIDSIIDQSVQQTQILQTRANFQTYSLENSLAEIQVHQKLLSNQLLIREFSPLGGPTLPSLSFKQTVDYSLQKSELNLQFYTSNNLGILLVSLILLGVCYAFILALKKTYDKAIDGQISEDQLILRYPFVSAIFIVSNLAQFLFNAPPFIFSLFFWLTSAASLTVLMRGYISKFWMFAWLSMLLLFIFASLDNLILQASQAERWYMLVLSLAGVAIGLVIFKNGKRTELREQLIIYAIGLMTLLEISSVLFNVFGSYNLAKALLVAGYVNLIIAIMFLWTVRLINQGLQLAFNLYAQQDK